MKKTFLLLTIAAAMAMPVAAQRTDAVTLVDSTSVVVTARQAYTMTRHTETLLQNGHAAALGGFVVQLNQDCTLESFAATFTDALGRVLRKVKKSELQRTEYAHDLAVDCYYLYLDMEPPSYPVTLTVDYSLRCTGNVLSFPAFAPMKTSNQQVRHAVYRLQAPEGVGVQWCTAATQCEPRQDRDDKSNAVLTFVMDNLAPLGNAPFAPPMEERLPCVRLAPKTFTYYGQAGSLASWKELGQWVDGLMTTSALLSDDARHSILAMTDSCTSVRSKIAVLYDYLRRNTRYVSIQLGIGGYRPMQADYVWRSGFGDCKALTNLMRAMLRVVGVEAYYTLVSTTDRRLLSMANFQQLDHVVLCVPMLDGDTLWMECTNPEEPLGYVPRHLAGHQAVVLAADGPRTTIIPDYDDADNLLTSRALVTLDASGTARVSIDQTGRAHHYWDIGKMEKLEKQKTAPLTEALHERFVLAQATVDSFSTATGRASAVGIPQCSLHFAATCRRYASATGTRLFLPASPLHKDWTVAPIDSARTQPLVIGQGTCWADTVRIALPEGYAIEALPPDTEMSEPFGDFAMQAAASADTIVVVSSLLLRKGTYPAQMAVRLRDFQNAVATRLRARIVARKP